jgi:hypothetical protein
LLVDVNNHVPCVNVGTTFERGPKEVKEQALRKRRLMGGSQMGLNQMESDGLQEVMVCVAVEDTGYAEWLEEKPKGVQLKVKEVADISVHARGAYVGWVVEETERKVEEWVPWLSPKLGKIKYFKKFVYKFV